MAEPEVMQENLEERIARFRNWDTDAQNYGKIIEHAQAVKTYNDDSQVMDITQRKAYYDIARYSLLSRLSKEFTATVIYERLNRASKEEWDDYIAIKRNEIIEKEINPLLNEKKELEAELEAIYTSKDDLAEQYKRAQNRGQADILNDLRSKNKEKNHREMEIMSRLGEIRKSIGILYRKVSDTQRCTEMARLGEKLSKAYTPDVEYGILAAIPEDMDFEKIDLIADKLNTIYNRNESLNEPAIEDQRIMSLVVSDLYKSACEKMFFASNQRPTAAKLSDVRYENFKSYYDEYQTALEDFEKMGRNGWLFDLRKVCSGDGMSYGYLDSNKVHHNSFESIIYCVNSLKSRVDSDALNEIVSLGSKIDNDLNRPAIFRTPLARHRTNNNIADYRQKAYGIVQSASSWLLSTLSILDIKEVKDYLDKMDQENIDDKDLFEAALAKAREKLKGLEEIDNYLSRADYRRESLLKIINQEERDIYNIIGVNVDQENNYDPRNRVPVIGPDIKDALEAIALAQKNKYIGDARAKLEGAVISDAEKDAQEYLGNRPDYSAQSQAVAQFISENQEEYGPTLK